MVLLKYDNTFGNLNVTGFIGGSYTKNKWSGKGGDNGTNNLLYPNVFSTENYPTNVVINEYGGETILQSIYGSVSLGYNDMFILIFQDETAGHQHLSKQMMVLLTYILLWKV